MRLVLSILLLSTFTFFAKCGEVRAVNKAESGISNKAISAHFEEINTVEQSSFSSISASVVDSLEVNILQDDVCDANGIMEIITPTNMSPPYNLEVIYPNNSVFTFAYNDGGFTLSNLNGGLYEITVFSGDDTSFASVDLPQIELNTNFYSPSFSTGGYNVSCYGDCDASLFINIINPSETYTVDWYLGSVSGAPFYSSSEVSSSQDNLCAGEYAILFTSSSGCESVREFTIREPDSLYTEGVSGEEVCEPDPNGYIEVDVFGGVGEAINNTTGQVIYFIDYTYSWTGPNGYTSSQEDISSLEAGNYTLEVEDNNGCTYTNSFNVVDVFQGLELAEINSEGITCNGGSDGSLEVAATGGLAPYEYRVDGGAWQSSGIFTGLSSGTYALEVKGGNNCIVLLDVDIENAEVLISETTIESCDTYTWNGTTYTESGTYTYLTQNLNGCDSTATLELSIVENSTGTDTQVHCEEYTWIDGVTYTESNTTATYTFLIAEGCDSIVTLNLTIDICGCTDALACNYDPSATSDDGSCEYEDPLDLGSDVFVCEGSYVLDAGSGYDTYLWSTGETTQTITVNQTGEYTVSTPCSNTDAIFVTLNYCDSLVVSVIQDDLCNSNGILEIIPPSSLTPPYAIDIIYPNGSIFNDDFSTEVLTLNGLGGGFYEITVSSNNDTASSTVELLENTLNTNFFSPASSGYNVSCYGDCDASLSVNIFNSSETYTVDWYTDSVFGVPFFSTTDFNSTQDNLCSGEYAILFTSSTGCESTRNFTVRQPDSLYTEGVVGEEVCGQDPNGFIEIDVFGGVGDVINSSTGQVISFVDYIYSWTGPNGFTSTQEDISSLEAGDYTLEIEDNNGCTHANAFTVIDVVQGLELSLLNNIGVTCYGGSDGSAEVVATGGQPPYDYRIDGGAWQSAGEFTGLSTGTYTLEVRDDNNCIVSLDVDIEGAEILSSETTLESCDTYTWNGTTYTASGTYTYTTTSANGCDSVSVLDLTIYENFTIEENTINTCYGESVNLQINNQDEWRWVTNEDTTIMYWNNGYPNSLSSCGAILDSDGFYTPDCSLNLPFVLEFDENSVPQSIIPGEMINGFELAVSCNSGAQNVTGNHYYISNFSSSWNEADSICNSLGGHLVSINSDDENNFVANIDNCFQGASSFWIGLYYYELDEQLIYWSNSESGSMISVSPFVETTYYVSNSSTENVCGDSITIYINEADTSFTDVTECESYEWNGEVYTESGIHTLTFSSPEIGSNTEGGVIFYIDSSTNLAYVATENYISTGQWGCSDIEVDGAELISIGSGYQNTQDIINSSCGSSQSAALTCANYDNGYDDWFLPSLDELSLIYQNLFQTGIVSYNTGNIQNWYWSSTEGTNNESNSASNINFADGFIAENNNKNSNGGGVIAVRTFNINICDSVAILNLTVIQPDTSNVDITACESYEWNGESYTESGTYTYTTTSANGCDSTAILNLTINETTFGTDVQSNCEEYTWIDGVTYTESNNTVTYTLTNSLGCDSIVTLDLTILETTESTTTIESCDTYTWNGTTYTASGAYTYTTTSANGCDSTATLNLTINETTFGTDTQVHCEEYTWIDGITYTSSNTTAAFTLISSTGCDSIVILDLTVLEATESTTSEVSCDTYTWNGTTYTASGTYTYTTTNAQSCDSVVTLNLTIDICGCTDALACNYDPSATSDDGSCEYEDPLDLGSDVFVCEGSYVLDAGSGYDTYLWSTGETTQTITVNQTGEYTVSTPCSNTDAIFVTLNYCDSLVVSVIQDDLCNSNGILEIIPPSSLTPPYAIDIIYPNGSIFNDDFSTEVLTLNGLGGGFYEITVSSNNDTASSTVELLENTLNTNFFSPASSGYNVSCYGDCDASLSVNIFNSSETYTVDWYTDSVFGVPFFSTTDFNSTQDNLCSGEYAILFTSSTGCESTRNFTVRQPDSLYTEGVVGEEVCGQDPNGFIEIDVFGGVGDVINSSTGQVISFVDYIYSWTGPNGFTSTQEDISSLEAGDYTLEIEDNNGCTHANAFTVIDVVQGLELSLLNNIGVTCYGGSDGSAEVVATGGQPPYDYRIDGGAWQSAGEFTGLSTGTYTLEVRDDNNCIVSLDVDIEGAEILSSETTLESCDTYTWNGTTYTESGTYTYLTQNANACDSTATLNLTINETTFGTDTQVHCEEYTWIDGITYTATNTTATFTLTSSTGCDSIVTLDLTILEATESTTSEVSCDTYTWNGTTYTESGTYTYTTTNANGCDSTATLNLTINETTFGTDVQSNCEEYTWIDGITYTESNNTATFTLTNSLGCDSIVTLDLTILETTESTTTIESCDTYTWNGTTYTESGAYTYTTTNANACDSTATLNLTINETTFGTDTQVHCEEYTWIDGITYTATNTTATFTLTNSTGCDSIVTLDLTILEATESTTSEVSCDTYTWNGTTYTESGTYTYTTTNANGCDSTATLNLTINETTFGTDVQSNCEEYTWIDGITYTESNNTATFTLTNSLGCDSIVTLDLTILETTESTTTIESCDTYTWNGTTYTESGAYTYTTTNANACDSTATLNLTINETTFGTDTQVHCEEYTWIDGITYTATNTTATFTLTNSTGCDSIVTLDLTILEATESTTSEVSCDTYTWNGTTYTESGTYTYTTTNVNSCDSTATLNLTINETTFGTDVQSNCEEYTWIDGITYTESNNTATFTLTNSLGCDSIVTLDLTILETTESTTTIESCDTYTWNGTTYTESGTYTYLTQNANACDSTATLNLTINETTFGTDTQVHCEEYTWIDGITYTATNTTATFTLTNSTGCDSIVTLDLTILEATESTTSEVSCDTYTWNGTTYTESGTYTYTTTNVNSCDSTATLNLTINETTFGTDVQSNCEEYTWIDGITYTESNNTATFTLTNSLGCDSIVTLDLTILETTESTTTIESCDTYTWNGTTYTESGAYTYTTTNANACDSTATLNLTINETTFGTDVQSNCEEYTWIDGITYTATNTTATFTLTNSTGCDSIVTLDLTIDICGCTDIMACNYDSLATADDGSCEYEDPIDLGSDVFVCEGSYVLDAGSGYDTYLWSTGDTTQTITVSQTGEYFVFTPCTSADTIFVTLNYCDSLVVSVIQDDLCNSNGIIEVIPPSSLTPPYAIDITFPNGSIFNNSFSSETFTLDGLSGGFYEITVSSNNDTASSSIEVLENILITNFFSPASSGYNVSCYGECDASLSVNIINPNEAYTVDWYVDSVFGTPFYSTSDFNSSQDNLCPGEYAILFTSSTGCESVRNVTLREPDSLYTEGFSSEEVCGQDPNGFIEIDVFGGVGDVINNSTGEVISFVEYTYSWLGPNGYTSSEEDIDSLEAGNYTLTVEDNNGCTHTNNFTVLDVVQGLELTEINSEGITCNGDSNGSVEVAAIGGQFPYEYRIDGGAWQSSGEFTGLSTGTYTLEVRDDNNCIVPLDVDIEDAEILSSETTIESCDTYTWNGTTYTESGAYTYTTTNANACDSTATLNLTINETTFGTDVQSNCEEYTWIDGITYTATNTTATFTLTNSTGCDSIVTLDLTIDICGCTDIMACNYDSLATADDGSCEYEDPIDLGSDVFVCEGSYVLDAGSGYDTYLWSTGDTTQTITVSQTGEYFVFTPCTSADTIFVTLNYCDSLVVSVIQDDLCNSNGIIEVIPPSSLTPPYAIDITFPNGSIFNNSFSSETFTLDGLSGGFYEITVSSNNDTASSSIEVLENILITNFFSPASSGYNVSCYGECDASLSVNIINPNEAYTVDWYVDSVFGTPFYSTSDFNSSQDNLCPGEYAILFTSSTGCESVRNVTLREPDSLYTEGFSSEEVCGQDPNGFIEIDVFGGVGDVINNSTGEVISFVEYTYSWLGPNGYTSSEEDIDSLEAGNYTLTVEDNNGCTHTNNFTVLDVVQGLELTEINSEGITCNGDSNGSVEVAAIGGQFPYEYRIDGGAWQSSGEFTGLSTGTYTLEVRDDNNCIVPLDVDIEDAEILSSETTIESCDTYTWNGTTYTESGAYTYTTTNANACDSTATLNLTINETTFGTDVQSNCEEYTWIDGITYTATNTTATFTLTNSTGCDSIVTLDLTIDICGCTDIMACNYDSLATADDGSCEYEDPIDLGSDVFVCEGSYVLDAGSGYDTYLWSTGDTTQTITVSQTGEYFVFTPCTSADTIFVTLNYCDSLVVSVIQDDLCNSNGIIEVIPPSSLTPPYAIDITFPNGSIFNNSFSSETFTLDGLSGGFYEITVSSNNDTASSSIEVLENILITNFFSPASSGYNVSCYGECDASLSVNIINPNEAYTVDWYVDSVFGTPFYSTSDFNSSQDNLCPGEYAILFTSSTGCESVRNVTLREPDSLYTEGFSSEEVCGQDPNGFIEIDVFGGVGDVINNSTGEVISFVEYTYSWLGPNGYTSSEEDIDSLEAGNYTLTVEDNNGCTHTNNFTVLDVVQGLELTEINSEGITCNGDSNGSVEVAAIGGQFPYEYRIDGGAWQSSGEFTGLSTGTYTLEVRDDNNCIVPLGVDIEDAEILSSEAMVESCITYEWNGTVYTSSGTYTYTTQNANGCDSTATLNLTISQSVTGTDTQVHCDDYTWIDGINYTESNNTAMFTLETTFGCDSIITLDLTILPNASSDTVITSCDSYVWNQTTFTQSGNYSFITTGSNGCDSIANLELTINQSNSIVDVQEHCYEYTWIDGVTYTESNNTATYTYTNVSGCDSTIALDLTVHQSTSSIDDVVSCNSYFWNGITYTESGTYSLNTTNVNGCDSTAILNLEIIEALSSSVTTVSACNQYTWNGTTYFESGMHMLVIPGITGCDSISTLLLTINTPTSSEENVVACDSYEWNGQLYTEGGVYEFATVDQNGCDSLAVLNLDICDLDELSINGLDDVQVESITSYSVQSNPSSTYQWSVSSLGTIVSGQGTNTISVEWSNIEGLTTICVTETNNCSNITCIGDTLCLDVEVVKPSSVNEYDTNFINVYPNPLTNQSKIEFFNPNSEEVNISIIDSRGRVVRTYTKIKSDNLIIKKEELSNGLYYIELKGSSILSRTTILIN